MAEVLLDENGEPAKKEVLLDAAGDPMAKPVAKVAAPPLKPPPGFLSLAGSAISGAAENIIPESFRHPVDTARAWASGLAPLAAESTSMAPGSGTGVLPGVVEGMIPGGPIALGAGRAVLEASKKQFEDSQAAGRSLPFSAATAIPLIGPAATKAGESIATGEPSQVAHGLGGAAGLLAPFALPGAVGAVGKATGADEALASQLSHGVVKSYARALNAPSNKLAQTALDVAPTLAGEIEPTMTSSSLAQKIAAKTAEAGRAVDSAISTYKDVPINKAEILKRIDVAKGPHVNPLTGEPYTEQSLKAVQAIEDLKGEVDKNLGGPTTTGLDPRAVYHSTDEPANLEGILAKGNKSKNFSTHEGEGTEGPITLVYPKPSFSGSAVPHRPGDLVGSVVGKPRVIIVEPDAFEDVPSIQELQATADHLTKTKGYASSEAIQARDDLDYAQHTPGYAGKSTQAQVAEIKAIGAKYGVPIKLGTRDANGTLVADSGAKPPTVADLATLKRVLDKEIVGNKAAWTDASRTGKVHYQKDVANILRDTLNDVHPDIAAANANFSQWANAKRVSDASQKAKAAGEVRGGGGPGGLPPTSLAGFAKKAFDYLRLKNNSAAWNTLAGSQKQAILEGFQSGEFSPEAETALQLGLLAAQEKAPKKTVYFPGLKQATSPIPPPPVLPPVGVP